MPKRCTRCGHQNPDEFRFCEQCGFKLEITHPARRFKPPSWLPWGLAVVLLVAGAYWLGASGGKGIPESPGTTGGTGGEWITYSDPFYHFTVQYPAGWVEGATSGSTLLNVGDPSVAALVVPNMNVSVDSLDVSLETYAQQYRQGFLTGPEAPPNGEVYSEQPAVINGVQAYVMVVGYDTTQGYRVKGKTAVIPGDQVVFRILCTVSDYLYEDYEEVFDAIIQSFTVGGRSRCPGRMSKPAETQRWGFETAEGTTQNLNVGNPIIFCGKNESNCG